MEINEMTLKINRLNAEQARPDYEAFKAETADPFGTNERLLLRILSDNQNTEYGKKYGFADIRSYAEYRERVPVITYDDISESIDRMVAGEKDILTAYPFDHMNQTSGTVGKEKLIPMTDRQAGVFLKYNKHFLDALYTEMYGEKWMGGRIFCTSEGTCRTTPSGITIGNASAKMAQYVQGGAAGLDRMIRAVYTSPIEATIPAPGTDTRYLHIRFALADRGIRGIVTGFFSYLVHYFHYIAEHYEMLIRDIETGTVDPSVELPPEVRASVLAKLEPMPERARELREVFRNGSDFRFINAVWPDLIFIIGVGGDGFSIYTHTLRNRYVDKPVQFIFSGVTASEGAWSLPVEAESEDGVLIPGSAFMEFLPVEAGNDFSQCLTMDQLEVGKTYELIITNVCGFYRYRMSDAVQVTGFYNKTPRVRFMYRVNRMINMAAEKTSEKALQQAVERTAEELGFELSDFTVYPDALASPSQYVFLIQPPVPVSGISEETLAEALERHLREANPVYEECVVADRNLQKAKAFWLQPESTFLWRDLQVARGRSANHLKPLRILQNEEQKKFFYILRDRAES